MTTGRKYDRAKPRRNDPGIVGVVTGEHDVATITDFNLARVLYPSAIRRAGGTSEHVGAGHKVFIRNIQYARRQRTHVDFRPRGEIDTLRID